jgi:two-component system, NarL family, sensor kinase
LLEFVGTAMDVTERHKNEEELRRLSGQLLRLHDEERRSIARDLHDTTAQGLVALAATLTQLHALVPSRNRRSRKLIAESEALAKECLREVRTLSYVLYPPMLEQAGLEDAIRHFRDGFVARTGIDVKLEIPRDLGRLGGEVELALFRVAQESLANVQRHSGSTNAEVRLQLQGGCIELDVTDQGHGAAERNLKNSINGEFPFAIGVGIASMHERIKQVGGRLQIRADHKGTSVRVTVPIHA